MGGYVEKIENKIKNKDFNSINENFTNLKEKYNCLKNVFIDKIKYIEQKMIKIKENKNNENNKFISSYNLIKLN